MMRVGIVEIRIWMSLFQDWQKVCDGWRFWTPSLCRSCQSGNGIMMTGETYKSGGSGNFATGPPTLFSSSHQMVSLEELEIRLYSVDIVCCLEPALAPSPAPALVVPFVVVDR